MIAYLTAMEYNLLKARDLVSGADRESIGKLGNLPLKVVPRHRLPEGVEMIVLNEHFQPELDERYPNLKEAFVIINDIKAA